MDYRGLEVVHCRSRSRLQRDGTYACREACWRSWCLKLPRDMRANTLADLVFDSVLGLAKILACYARVT